MNSLIALLATTVFGTILTFLIHLEIKRLERISLGILLGFGLQTLFMFFFYVFGLRFTLLNTILEMGVLSVVSLIVINIYPKNRKSLSEFISLDKKVISLRYWSLEFSKLDLIQKIFLIYIFGLLVTSLVVGLFFPVYGWDSLVLYDFRAVVFNATGGMEDGIARGYFFGYPLMTSLAHTWLYFWKGNPHIFYWSIYLALIVNIYYCLRKFFQEFTLILTTSVIASLPSVYNGSFFDYTNFPYLVYLVVSILFICRYMKDQNKNYLIISAILLGLSTWVRQTEPFWVVNLAAIVFLVFKDFRKNLVQSLIFSATCALIFFSIQQPWRLYEQIFIGGGRNINDQAGYALKSFSHFDFYRLFDVIGTTISGTLPTWQPYLMIAIFMAILSRKWIKKGSVFLYFLLGNIFLLFLGTYIFSFIWPENWKDIIDSQQRLSSFIVPLLIIFIASITDDQIILGMKTIEDLFKYAVSRVFV